MNKGLYFIGILMVYCQVQSSIYDIEFKKIEGGNVSMSEFRDKKIIVVLFNAANPDAARLRYLDSLQLADESLQVIGIPATDFAGEGKQEDLKAFNSSLSAKFVMARQASVKKETGIRQQPLLGWLTQVKENGHFDTNATDVGQLFIISNTGILYSVLDQGVPEKVLMEVLKQEIR